MKKRFTWVLLSLITLLSACEKNDDEPEAPFQSDFILEIYSDDDVFRVQDTLHIIARPEYPDSKAKKVLFYYGEQVVGSDTLSPFEYDLVLKKTGRHNIRLRIYNEAGNSAMSKTIQIFVHEHLIPDVSIQSIPLADHYVVGDSLKFEVSASSANGEIVSTSFYINRVLFGTDSIAPFTFKLDSLQKGSFSYFATATDEQGFEGRTYERSKTVKENSIPRVSLYDPHPGDYFLPGKGVDIQIFRSDEDDDLVGVEIYANDSLIRNLGMVPEFTWTDMPGGDYTLQAIAYDSHGGIGYSELVDIKVYQGISTQMTVNDLLPSENDDLVFGLSYETSSLLLINPQTLSFTEISLPGNKPVSMDYSQAGQKLFIAHQYGSTISIWNNNTQSLSSLEISQSVSPVMIKQDSQHNRLYMLASSGLFIINADNGNILLDSEPVEGNSIVVDPEHRWLFTGATGNNTRIINKYDIAGDELALLDSTSFHGHYDHAIAIHPGNDYLVLPDEDLSAAYAYDTQNLNNIVGEFGSFYGWERVVFSPNGQIMLGNYYSNFYVMNAQNFQRLDVLEIPHSRDFIRYCTDYSADRIIVYTHNEIPGGGVEDRFIYILDLP